MSTDWTLIDEDGFQIAFPQEPLHYRVPTPDPNNSEGQIYTHCYNLETSGTSDINFFYGISYIDYPESDLHHTQFPLKIKYFLDAVVNSLVADIFTGELRRVLSTNRQQYVGRMIDVRALDGQFMYKIHLLLAGYRIYIIQTVTHSQWAENDRVKKFIASFNVKEDLPVR